MSALSKIEIHGVDQAGNKYVLNHLTTMNVEFAPQHLRPKLIAVARTMAAAWKDYFRDDRIFVVEVTRKGKATEI